MRVMHRNRIDQMSRKGFTLSEILISVALMAFVATAAIGGIVVLFRVRETLDRQSKAEMIMIATESYLRDDLNCCTNPDDMDCSVYYLIDKNDANLYGPVFYDIDPSTGRYGTLIIKDASGNTTGNVVGTSPKVQYWNSEYGICVGLIYSSLNPSSSGPEVRRKYVIAQNVMDDTNMYTLIGNDKLEVGDTYSKGNNTDFIESIDYDEGTKLFTFCIYVLDKNTNKVIMKQFVEVCPDPLVPTTTNNP